MVTFAEIHPYDGSFTLYNQDTGNINVVKMEAVFPEQRENISEMFKFIRSHVTTYSGGAYINLGPEYNNAFRKKLVEEGLRLRFGAIKIINDFSMRFFNVIAQTDFELRDGAAIWILHDICPGEEYCDIWKMEGNKNAKFVKTFKCFWHNLTPEKAEAIKDKSSIEKFPDAIFYPSKHEFIKTKTISSQTFPYLIKKLDDAIIKCYRKKYINDLPILDREITVKFRDEVKFKFTKTQALPINESIKISGYKSMEISITSEQKSIQRDPNNIIPSDRKLFKFEIDSNGIYSYSFQNPILLTIWDDEIDVHDSNVTGSDFFPSQEFKQVITLIGDVKVMKKNGYVTYMDPKNHRNMYPQAYTALSAEDLSNHKFLSDLIQKLPEAPDFNLKQKSVIRRFLTNAMEDMFLSRRANFGYNSRSVEMDVTNYYDNMHETHRQNTVPRENKLQPLLKEITKNSKNCDVLFFLPNKAEEPRKFIELLNSNGIKDAYYIDMINALANGIYKKYGSPDFEHYIFAISRQPYVIFSHFQIEDSKVVIKKELCERCDILTFEQWLQRLQLPKFGKKKIHLTTSNLDIKHNSFWGYEFAVVEEKNFYQLIDY